jgi:short-subunit dehydrogenase
MPQTPPTNDRRHTAATTAFVTGASSGIGRAIVEKLLAENHRVWGTSRDPARLDGLAQKFPDAFTPVALDLDNPDAAQAAFERAAAQAGPAGDATPAFDIVINNAGYGLFAPFAETPFVTWQRQIDAMLSATARLAHAALRGMVARNRGCLVNVSSLAVNFPLPCMSAYNIAKAGISALSESLVFETRGTNITIIDFRPGDYRTSFNKVMSPAPGFIPAPETENRKLQTENSRDEVARVWRTLDAQFNAAPPPERAARDLLRAIARGRSGTVRSGTFFQARLSPLAARLLPATLMRSLQARYFGAT